ncbi:MAG: ABC transporter ATP-binding protein [Flavobacteriaceae bacterium]
MLALRGISKIYPDGTNALAPTTLNIAEGEIVALVGGSGCGKSTLLRLVAGLDGATTGSAEIDGTTVDGPHPAIGIVFQEPRLLPWLSVAGNVGFGLAGISREERRRRVEHALALVHLEGYGERWPKQLSGGQAQRVAIARALIARPKAILLDEPFSALDALTRKALHDLLRNVHASDRQTLLIVTHDVDEAVALGNRVVVMQPRPGRLFAEIDIPRRQGVNLPVDPDQSRKRVLAALDGSLADSLQRAEAPEAAGFWW